MSNTENETLPKQDLLLKLLKMTTSANDGEALTAIRKANAVLLSAGWDWDKLISGKIRIVENPFSKIEDPFANYTPKKAPRTTPKQPSPQQPPSPLHVPPRPGPDYEWSSTANIWVRAPTPDHKWDPFYQRWMPPPPPPLQRNLSTKPNLYANWCYCCGVHVLGGDGFVFKPQDHNFYAPSEWKVVCKTCNTSSLSIPRSAAVRQKKYANPSLNNL